MKNNYTNAQVPDTSAYIQQIIANKNNYIGKPFSTLSKDLQIQIKYFNPFASFDFRKETATLFQFIKPVTMADFSEPIMDIEWSPYLNMKVSDSLWDKNDGGGWTSEVAAFYSTGIIKDIILINPQPSSASTTPATTPPPATTTNTLTLPRTTQPQSPVIITPGLPAGVKNKTY